MEPTSSPAQLPFVAAPQAVELAALSVRSDPVILMTVKR
jgi:hypothetical protein